MALLNHLLRYLFLSRSKTKYPLPNICVRREQGELKQTKLRRAEVKKKHSARLSAEGPAGAVFACSHLYVYSVMLMCV